MVTKSQKTIDNRQQTSGSRTELLRFILNPKRIVFFVLSAAVFTAFALVSFDANVVLAQGINKTIHFQGKVVNSNGTNVADGQYTFVFKLYDAATNGSELWSETQNNVQVTAGVFRVSLGSVTSFESENVDFNSENLHLSINFNSDGEMTPRIRFASVPYAFNAEKVAGLTVTNTTGTLTIPDSKTVEFGGAFTTSAQDLTLTLSGATTVTLPTTGTLATLAGNENLSNKTFTSTVTISGATVDLTTASNEVLVIAPNGTGNVVVQTQAGGQAALIVDKTGQGDIFAASSSGVPKFTIKSDGNASSAAGFTVDGVGSLQSTNNQTLTVGGGSTGSLVIGRTSQTVTLPGFDCSGYGNQGKLTTTTGGVLTCAADTSGAGGGDNFWQYNSSSGIVANGNLTTDLLIGGTSTQSAMFSILGIAAGTNPVASVSAQSGANATKGIYLSGDGSLQSVRNNTLTIGGNTTGNISLNPNNGSGIVTVNGTLAAKTSGGATIVVAASDSSTKGKLQADFVADGTDDDVTIEAAIAALPAGGGTVSLLEGTFSIGDAGGDGIDITDTNVILEGAGRATILQRQGDTAANDGVVTVGDDGSTAVAGVILRNFSIDGVKASISGTENIGIYFNENITESKIESIYTHDNDGNGIYLRGTGIAVTDVVIENNDIRDNDDNGIELSANQTDRIIIRGNHIQDNAQAGILATSTDNVTIANNTIYSNSTNGITANSANNRMSITGNNIVSNTGIGLSLSVIESSIVSNAISSNTSHGISLASSTQSHNTISSNAITTSGGVGINIGSSSTENLITGNFIEDSTSHAILVNNGADRTTITGNHIDTVGASVDGIQVNQADYTLISGNTIYDPASSVYGIDISASQADYTLIVGNDISGAGFSAKINDLGTSTTIQQRDQFMVNGSNPGKALLILDQQNANFDIVSASVSGVTKFRVTNDGTASSAAGFTIDGVGSLQSTRNQTLTIGGGSTGEIIFGRTSQQVTLPGFDCSGYGNSGKLTTTTGGVLTCAADISGGGSGSSNWVLNSSNGTLSPINNTTDLLLGGTTTASAKFAVLNVNGSGPATASVSGNLVVMPHNGTGGKVGFGTTNPLGAFNVASNFNTSLSLLPNDAVVNEGNSTNLLTENQSNIETGTTGLNATGISIARVTSQAWEGSASLQVDTDAGGVAQAGVRTDSISVSPSQTYTASAYVKGSGTIRVSLQELDSGNSIIDTTAGSVIALTSNWQRIRVTATFSASGVNARVFVRTIIAQTTTFYVDGIQLEQEGYVTAWVPGGLTRGAGDIQSTGRLVITGQNANLLMGKVGIGTLSPVSQFHVTHPLALGATGKALAIFDQIENQDIFTASAAGVAKFTVKSNGAIQFQDDGTFDSCSALETVNGLLTCGSDDLGGGGANVFWQYSTSTGILAPGNLTTDLLVGGSSTISAKFAILGVASDTPVASISASNGSGLFLSYDGSIQTTKNRTLTLGGGSTGDIFIKPGNTSALSLLSSGNVGIGTTLPEAQLHINGSAEGLRIQGVGAAGATTQSYLTLYSSLGSILGTLGDNLNTDSNFRLNATDALVLGSNGNDHVFISTTGTVGIGQELLEGHLHVTRPLTLGATGKALLTLNQIESQDILAASASGTTKFVIKNDGTASTSGNLIFNTVGTLTAGSIQMINNQSLIIGGSQTGDIIFRTGDILNKFAILHNTIQLQGSAPTITTSSTNASMTLTPNGSGNVIVTSDSNSGLLIGTSSNVKTALSVSGGVGSNALAIFDQLNGGDLLAASSAGVTKFRLTNDGTASSAAGFTIDGVGSVQSTRNQTLTVGGGSTGDLVIGRTSQTVSLPGFTSCTLKTSGGVLTCGTDLQGSGGGDNFWQYNSSTGIVANGNLTTDLLIGGVSTLSAEFAVTGIAAGTNPSASVSATTGSNAGSGVVISGDGSIQSLRNGTLTLGGPTTGNILLLPKNGTGYIGIGTSKPSALLQIGDGDDGPAQPTSDLILTRNSATSISVRDSGNEVEAQVYAGPGEVVLGSFTNHLVDLKTNNTTTMRLTNNQTVGLGTTSPLGQFHVTRDISKAVTGKALAIFDQYENQDIFSASKSGVTRFTINKDGKIGINNRLHNNSDILSTLDVRANPADGGTLSIASLSGRTAMAGLIVDNSGLGELFTASSSGTTRFVLTNSGVLGLNTGNKNALLLSTLDIRSNPTNGGTLSIASFSGRTAHAGLIVDNSGAGDIFTASSSGITRFTITQNGRVQIGSITDGLTFDYLNGGPTYTGTARPTKVLTLSPEYPGAILTASGSATTNGSITSDASASAHLNRTYYEWTSTQAILQDYVVAVRVTLPNDFSSWPTSGNAMTISLNTASTGNTVNGLDVYIYNSSDDANGRPVYFSTNNTSSVAKTWTTVNLSSYNLDNNASPDWDSAGETVTIYLKMKASGTHNFTQLGDIVINYLSKF